MEKILSYLKDYQRARLLQVRIPELEKEYQGAKDRSGEASLAAAQAKWELEKQEKGSFFDRLLGKQEEKKKKAWQAYREAQAGAQAAKEALTDLEKTRDAARHEAETLSGSWEKYLREKTDYLNRGGDLEQLRKEEIPILAAVGAEEIRLCLADLEEARFWMQKDIRRQYVSQDNRKLEFLGKARERGLLILALLKQLPEGSVETPNCLQALDGYITGVTMPYKQLDQLNNAQEKLRGCREKLRKI